MDAGASASAKPAGLPVHDARPVGCAHPASRARPAGAASHSRKGAGRGLDRPLAASAASPRPGCGLRVYEITGGSHRSDFSYRLLGEAEYKEIWKKPSRRRF